MVIRFYLDHYQNRHGLRKVMCELKNSGWIVRIKTGIYAKPENWNQTRQQLKPSHPNQVTGNALITGMRTDLERLWLTEIAEGREPFPETVREKYRQSKGTGTGDLWQHLEAFTQSKDKEATRMAYEYLTRDLKNYEQAHRRRLDFSAMGVEFFESFRRWMRAKGWKKNTVALRLATLRAFLRHGHAAGWHANTSYQHIRQEREKTKQVVLTAEEVERIRTATLPEELQEVRDVFIFQVFTGLRASDISRADVQGDTLRLRTKKTDTPLTLTLNDTALNIWHKYGGRVPVSSLPNYNIKIKEVCRLSGITGAVHYRGSLCEKWQAVGSHTARRTCAALLHEKGVALKKISLILGHASVVTTEDYLRHLSPGGDLSGL